MAHLPTPFNAHTVEPASASNQMSVSDANGHLVIISASEFKPSKNNPNAGYLELMMQVIDGPAKGETGPYRLNLFNDNPVTVDIANRQLSAICHVTNQMMISDSSQLHNIPFRAIVGLQKKAKPEDPDYTEVKGVLDVNGNKPGKSPVAGGTPAPAASPFPVQGQPAATPIPAPAWAAPGAPAATPAPAGAAAPPWAR